MSWIDLGDGRDAATLPICCPTDGCRQPWTEELGFAPRSVAARPATPRPGAEADARNPLDRHSAHRLSTGMVRETIHADPDDATRRLISIGALDLSLIASLQRDLLLETAKSDSKRAGAILHWTYRWQSVVQHGFDQFPRDDRPRFLAKRSAGFEAALSALRQAEDSELRVGYMLLELAAFAAFQPFDRADTPVGRSWKALRIPVRERTIALRAAARELGLDLEGASFLSELGSIASALHGSRRGKAAIVVVGSIIVGALVAVWATPAVGAAVGKSLLGLHGAAAVNAGLATLGGGALSAGGFGVAGGAVTVAVGGSVLGAAVGGVGSFALVPLPEEVSMTAAKIEMLIRRFLTDQPDRIRGIVVAQRASLDEYRRRRKWMSREVGDRSQVKQLDAVIAVMERALARTEPLAELVGHRPVGG